MAKKTISTTDLEFLFHEEMRVQGSGKVPLVAVAIIPDPVQGWSVITSAASRKRHPALAATIAVIEAKLRKRYSLNS